jgi:hypothetical protein
LVLAVIVPASFLVVFVLSSLTSGPVLAETVVLEPAKWEFEKPYYSVHFDDRVDSVYSNDICMNSSVLVLGITSPESAFGGPLMGTRITLTASVRNGYVENVNVTFSDDYPLSLINMYHLDGGGKEKDWAVWNNLTATDYAYWVRGTEKAFVNLKGANRPQGVYFYIGQGWLLESPNNQTQQLTMIVEVTYFNGTAHKKVTQPFQIRLVADDDNTFDTAKEIVSNQTLMDFLGGEDCQDIFRIFAESGDIVKATMTPSLNNDFDLYLYDSSKRDSVVTSRNRGNSSESIYYVINATGWWFIKVEPEGGLGIYTLDITIIR